MATWPASLPTAPSSFGEKPQPIGVSTQPDSGPSKARRRFTKPVYKGKMGFMLTNAQGIILRDFYNDTLLGGSQQCQFVHPWTGDTVDMRFIEAPDINSDGPLNVQASVEFIRF
jgi:hypothetical protein